MKCAVDRYLGMCVVGVFAALVSLCFVFLTTPHVEAQVGVGGQGFSLRTEPSLPEPYASVTVSIDDYTINTIGAGVIWSVNGVEQEDLKDARSVTVDAGGLGETQTITATLVRSDGSQVSASTTITPTVLDVVLEADTYVPSFYEGRALPGRTSTLRAIAILHDGKAAGGGYAYRWTLGQDVLFGGPARDKHTISFPMPLYSKALTVEVMDPEGRTIARKSMTPRSVEPELYFYEWSPLKGLYQNAIPDPFPLIGEETTVYGEPYFVNTSPTAENAEITWRIGRQPVPSDVGGARSLTLTRDLLPASGQIALRILTRDKVPQLLEGSFNVIPY